MPFTARPLYNNCNENNFTVLLIIHRKKFPYIFNKSPSGCFFFDGKRKKSRIQTLKFSVFRVWNCFYVHFSSEWNQMKKKLFIQFLISIVGWLTIGIKTNYTLHERVYLYISFYIYFVPTFLSLCKSKLANKRSTIAGQNHIVHSTKRK